jgi:hypothetical protein
VEYPRIARDSTLVGAASAKQGCAEYAQRCCRVFAPVEALSDEVSMSGVAGQLLDEVEQNPAAIDVGR